MSALALSAAPDMRSLARGGPSGMGWGRDRTPDPGRLGPQEGAEPGRDGTRGRRDGADTPPQAAGARPRDAADRPGAS